MFLVRRPAARIARVAVGTAVVAGTAGVVNHKMDQHYANQANAQASQQQMADMQAQQEQLAMQQQQLAMQQQQAAQAAQQAPAQVAAPTGSMTDQKVADLQKLAELQKQGILTQEEFNAQKAKILAS